MAKRKDSQSLQALKAIWGDSVVNETEPEPADPVVEAAPAEEPAPQPAVQQAATLPVVSEVQPELAPAPRRVGRPASKTPKRSYGVSLSTVDYDALREMAKGADKSITEMLEDIIREYDRNHPALREKYRKIQALLNS